MSEDEEELSVEGQLHMTLLNLELERKSRRDAQIENEKLKYELARRALPIIRYCDKCNQNEDY